MKHRMTVEFVEFDGEGRVRLKLLCPYDEEAHEGLRPCAPVDIFSGEPDGEDVCWAQTWLDDGEWITFKPGLIKALKMEINVTIEPDNDDGVILDVAEEIKK